ncbi:MAG TPA: hypothetical protein VFF88_04315, partial [Methylocella sp.]|nr:hypothetical protein [Methylocella sp.]
QLGPSLAQAAGADFTRPLHAKPGAEVSGIPAKGQHHTASGGTAPPGKEGVSHGARERAFQKKGPPPGGFAQERAPAKTKPPPRRRKHISVLRAGQAAPGEARKRRIYEETADRRGRVITVERLSAARGAGGEASQALVKKPVRAKPLTARKPRSPKSPNQKPLRKPVPKPGARRRPERRNGQKPPPARGKP